VKRRYRNIQNELIVTCAALYAIMTVLRYNTLADEEGAKET